MNGSHDARKIAPASAPARTIGCTRVERLAAEPPEAGELRVRLAAARDERARHVRPAARRAVLRPDVDDDRLAGPQRAGARVMAVGAGGAAGHDHVARQVRRPSPSATAAMASRTSSEVSPGPELADQLRRDGHRGVGRLLRAPHAGDLRGRLRPPAGDERLRRHDQRDALAAQQVGDAERELGGDERLLDPERAAGAERDPGLALQLRHAGGDEVVERRACRGRGPRSRAPRTGPASSAPPSPRGGRPPPGRGTGRRSPTGWRGRGPEATSGAPWMSTASVMQGSLPSTSGTCRM